MTFSGESGNYNNSDVQNEIAIAREIKNIIYYDETIFLLLRLIAVCTDDAGQYARARRILAKRFSH